MDSQGVQKAIEAAAGYLLKWLIVIVAAVAVVVACCAGGVGYWVGRMQ